MGRRLTNVLNHLASIMHDVRTSSTTSLAIVCKDTLGKNVKEVKQKPFIVYDKIICILIFVIKIKQILLHHFVLLEKNFFFKCNIKILVNAF